MRSSEKASFATDIDGPFVTSWLTGAKFRLQQEAGEAPAVYESGRYLPPDTVFVVRPGALETLIRKVSEASPEEKRVTRERDTLQEAMPASEVAAESYPALRAPTVPELKAAESNSASNAFAEVGSAVASPEDLPLFVWCFRHQVLAKRA